MVALARESGLELAVRSGGHSLAGHSVTDGGQARVRQAYPGSTWDRLVVIKRRYDPTNLFHHNHNIPPTPPAGPDAA